MEDLKKRFEKLMSSYEKGGKDKLIKYLEKRDFFTAPYTEDGEKGDLLLHTLCVYDAMTRLIRHELLKENMQKITQTEIMTVGLFHAIGRVGYFKETENGFIIEDQNPLGSCGEKAAIMLMQFIKLKSTELYAIRWQNEKEMRHYNVEYLQEKYPLIKLLQCGIREADLLLKMR